MWDSIHNIGSSTISSSIWRFVFQWMALRERATLRVLSPGERSYRTGAARQGRSFCFRGRAFNIPNRRPHFMLLSFIDEMFTLWTVTAWSRCTEHVFLWGKLFAPMSDTTHTKTCANEFNPNTFGGCNRRMLADAWAFHVIVTYPTNKNNNF